MRNVPQLKLVREDQGWSQRDLAARSGVAQNTISQLERGERQAMPSTVRKLAEALGVEPSVLLVYELVPREHEVLRLMKQGHSMSEVAQRLHMSRATVMVQLENIMTKLTEGTREASRQREADQRQETQPLPDCSRLWKAAAEESRKELEWNWAEYYVSGNFVEVEESISPEQKESILSIFGERYLGSIIPALLSYNEDLFVARSRVESNDPKETIEAAQLVLRGAKRIAEEYDSKLHSFRRIPEHYYADPAAHSRIMKLQKALSEQRVAAAEAIRELMDVYAESLDALEDQILGMRKESDVLEEFVMQAHDWER
jgi:DNA-binding XRE family transcriptional regulator